MPCFILSPFCEFISRLFDQIETNWSNAIDKGRNLFLKG